MSVVGRKGRSRDTRGARNFARTLMVLALAPLVLGAWGCYQGWRTRSWPGVEAVILGSDMRLVTGERRRSDGTSVTEERTTVNIRYRYSVGGRDYVGDGIRPYSYGMQNSAAARRQAEQYRPGSTARVVYDPDRPGVSYLEPGPSSVSTMLLGIGFAMGLSGLWVRSLARRGVGTMAGEDQLG